MAEDLHRFSFADLLTPEMWAALLKAGYITPDYQPLREALHLAPHEIAWLEKEMKKRPTGPYARFLAGAPPPK